MNKSYYIQQEVWLVRTFFQAYSHCWLSRSISFVVSRGYYFFLPYILIPYKRLISFLSILFLLILDSCLDKFIFLVYIVCCFCFVFKFYYAVTYLKYTYPLHLNIIVTSKILYKNKMHGTWRQIGSLFFPLSYIALS